MQEYLKETYYMDYNNHDIMNMVIDIKKDTHSPADTAAALFRYVRDSVSYSPYIDFFAKSSYIASNVFHHSHNFCVPKAILLASMCRAAGIPSRLRFAVIRNRLMAENLTVLMNTDIIYGHGLAELYINEKWVQATPAFDSKMSERFGFKIVDFTGDSDAVLPGYDRAGNAHVEYLEYTEPFSDFPFDYYTNFVSERYPGFAENIDSYLSMIRK